MGACVGSCSLSSGTGLSPSDSVLDTVSAWGCGNSCFVAGAVSVASPGILCRDVEPRWRQKESELELSLHFTLYAVSEISPLCFLLPLSSITSEFHVTLLMPLILIVMYKINYKTAILWTIFSIC